MSDRFIGDHPAQPHRFSRLDPIVRGVAWGVKIGRLILERRHGEQRGTDHGRHCQQYQHEPLMFGFHRLSRSASARASARRMARKLHSVTPAVPRTAIA